MTKLLAGQQLDQRYEIISRLGQGGMGTVYRARDLRLQQEVALKIMDQRLARQPQFRDLFFKEVAAAARLSHPGVVQVYGVKDRPQFYIVMEYLAGRNLRQELQARQEGQSEFGLAEALRLVRQVSLILAYAHGQGVIHGDLKPDNIMLAAGTHVELPYRPVLTDFGLARLQAQGRELWPQARRLRGTPAYAAPEQMLSQTFSPQSDIYALGVVLYLLVVGRLPFDLKTTAEALAYHRRGLPPPVPRSVRPDLPGAVETIILTALARDPARRFISMNELAGALEGALPAVAAR